MADANALGLLLQRLIVSEEQRNDREAAARDAVTRSRKKKPNAIHCKSFKIGDNFPNYVIHFEQCVKASYDAPTDDELKAACLIWLPTKLEPGPTFIAFDTLDVTVKADWPRLVTALTEAYADETERETFLADVGSFRRGSKSLVEYKNELMRLMSTYQPDLKGVDREYQRQSTTRFIEGLEDDGLKRKLRRHCKRDKMTLEEAYLFTVDFEASDLQSRIREGETAALGLKTLGAIEQSAPRSILQPTAAGGGDQFQKLQEEVKGLASKSKIAEMRIQELSAKSAHTNDRIDILSKEVGQVAVNVTKLDRKMETKFDEIKQLLTQNQNGQSQQSFQGPNQYNQQYRSNHQRGQGRGGFRGGFQAGVRGIQPSLTGGAGYVNNQVQPQNFRMQSPGSNVPVRPAAAATTTTQPPTTTPTPTPAAALAATAEPEMMGASGGEAAHPRMDPDQQAYQWWSPAMEEMPVTGYGQDQSQTLSYGGGDFY